MIKPALILWDKYKKSTNKIKKIYFSLMKVIVQGTLKYFEYKDFLPQAKKFIKNYLKRNGLNKILIAKLMTSKEIWWWPWL